MSLITVVPVEAIAAINGEITGRPVEPGRLERAKSCLAAYFYYEWPQTQAASIIYALAKDHFFVDGNKRTAFITYITLARLNRLPFLKEPRFQADAFVWLASECRCVEDCSKRLFYEN